MATAVRSPQPRADAPRRFPWPEAAWLLTFLLAAYFPILKSLVWQWTTDEDAGHGLLVPVVAGFLVWQRRQTLSELRLRPCWWGLILLAWGSAQAWIGMLGAELFLQRSAILISLLGLLLMLGGTDLVRALTFPLLLLPFMIPMPAVIYNQVTFPLQLFASRVAESALELVGIPVFRDGNILELASQKLSVAEACSGIRSLLSLAFLSLAYGYFCEQRRWMRWVLFAATPPIAIAANAGRVTITGVLSEIDVALARGFFHGLEGWIIFGIALAMLLGFHWCLRLVVEAGRVEEAGHA